MLPDEVWYHYYDYPCDICEEQIHVREEDPTSCSYCRNTMCEACYFGVDCHVCKEAEDLGQDFPNEANVCPECMITCDRCNVTFHPNCKRHHKMTCNPKGRAKRAMEKARDAVIDIEEKMEQAERNLEALKQQLMDAKTEKRRATKRYRNT